MEDKKVSYVWAQFLLSPSGEKLIETLEKKFPAKCVEGNPLLTHESLVKQEVVKYIKNLKENCRRELENESRSNSNARTSATATNSTKPVRAKG